MTARGYVQTVLGPVRPETLGLTLVHEHLLVDLRGSARSAEEKALAAETAAAAMSRPDAGWEPGRGVPGPPPAPSPSGTRK